MSFPRRRESAYTTPPGFRIKYDVEALWVPDDIDTRWHQLGHDAFMQKCNPDNPTAAENFTHDGILHDFRPDVFLISGEARRIDDDTPFEAAAVNCKVGQTVLVRFIDATYAINEIRFGLPAQIIAEDGYPFGVPPRGQYSHPIDLAAASQSGLRRPCVAMCSFAQPGQGGSPAPSTISTG